MTLHEAWQLYRALPKGSRRRAELRRLISRALALLGLADVMTTDIGALADGGEDEHRAN